MLAESAAEVEQDPSATAGMNPDARNRGAVQGLQEGVLYFGGHRTSAPARPSVIFFGDEPSVNGRSL